MVLESIYDPEFPDASHFRSGRGTLDLSCLPAYGKGRSSEALMLVGGLIRRASLRTTLIKIKEEWGSSNGFLEFDIEKFFKTIDRHRLVPILKEEIDDPKFFYYIQKVFSGLLGGERGSDSVPESLLLSALPGNIYLQKLDKDIGRSRHKYEIPITDRLRLVLLRTGNQENSGEETGFSAPKRASILGRSIQGKTAFYSFCSSEALMLVRGQGERVSKQATNLNKSYSLLSAALLIEDPSYKYKAYSNQGAELYGNGRERFNKNLAMSDLSQSRKRKELLIKPGGEVLLVLGSERSLAQKPFQSHYFTSICYARYTDDSLLGILGAIELFIEIQNRIAHFLQYGLNLGSAGSTIISARSTVEFLGMVIREVTIRTTTLIQLLRELEKRLRVKRRIHITACHLRSAIHSKLRNLDNTIPLKKLTKGVSETGSLLDVAKLADTFGAAGVKSNTLPRPLLSYNLGPAKARGERWARNKFPVQIEAPIQKIVQRLRDRGLIRRRRFWPNHVACFTNVSDGDIVNWSAGIARSLLSYYRCCDNYSQVRTIVDHQIRWSAILTLAHRHKSSAHNIIPKYSKDLVIKEFSKTLAEFPKRMELGEFQSR